jgi:hypothetical protein
MTNPTPEQQESIVDRLRAQATWVPVNYGRVADVMREAADMLEALSTQPEPEWEWGFRDSVGCEWERDSEKEARDYLSGVHVLIRRRAAGPWEEVTE